MEGAAQRHLSVLYHEVLAALDPQPGGHYLDGTLGMGGHAWGILTASSPSGTLLALDQDPTAIELAKQRLRPFKGRWTIVRSNFVDMKRVVEDQLSSQKVRETLSKGDSFTQNSGEKRADQSPADQPISVGLYDGILLDLGFSSLQMDDQQRGFSFRANSPLDMRFDPFGTLTAADLVNTLDEKALADLIYQYGEERKSYRIARAIVRHRPFVSARQLGDLIAKVMPASRKKNNRHRIHPATRTFQALRIAVNKELEVLTEVLPDAVSLLKPGGRLAVITFHSLEDRIVKNFFRTETTDCLCRPEILFCTCGHKATLDRRRTTRKPIVPSAAEVESNRSARSAKLRVGVRLSN